MARGLVHVLPKRAHGQRVGREKCWWPNPTPTELSSLFSPSASLNHHLSFNDLWMQENAAKVFLSLSHMPGNVLCTFKYSTSLFPRISPSRYSYQTNLRSICPKHSKANLPTLGCDEGKGSICCKTSSDFELMLKKPASSMPFREGFLKATGGRGLGGAWSACGHSSDWSVVR